MVKTVLFTVKYTNFLGASPFRVDHRRGKLYVHFWSHFRTLYFWAWCTTYSIIGLSTHLYELHVMGETRKLNFTVIINVCGFLCSIVTGTLSFRTQGWCQIYNSFFQFLPDLSNKYMQSYKFARDRLQNKMVELGMVSAYSVISLLDYLLAIECCISPYRATYVLFNVRARDGALGDLSFGLWLVCNYGVSFYIGNGNDFRCGTSHVFLYVANTSRRA